jgi:uncharacterized membrane-anchored protein
MASVGSRCLLAVAAAIPVLLGTGARRVEAQPRQPIQWTAGPGTVEVGDGIAEVQLGQNHKFAGAADTKKLLTAMGNRIDNTEVGMVAPTTEDQDWILIFEYKDVGYVKDDEKDKIDADEILKGIQEGTEAGNKMRKERGIPGLHVVGWQEAPSYDPATHNLHWAILGRDDQGDEVVNYNVRLLGRAGYMSVTLVESPLKLAASKPELDTVLSSFAYKQGKTYAEFIPGDKLAKYGLTALVAGGAGAAAVKLGLFAVLGKMLAKMGKAVVLLFAAAAAGVKKLIASLTGRDRTKTG